MQNVQILLIVRGQSTGSALRRFEKSSYGEAGDLRSRRRGERGEVRRRLREGGRGRVVERVETREAHRKGRHYLRFLCSK